MTIENVVYKEKTLAFNGSVVKYTGKVLLGLFLSIITLGIYMPWFIRDLHGSMAMLRLYQYFTERTVATLPDRKLNFGYDIDQLNDFLFIWGQTLLVIVTLGIYYPWSFCKICKRILNKTYILDQSSV